MKTECIPPKISYMVARRIIISTPSARYNPSMAPILENPFHSDDYDDFVLTISDNDQDLSIADEDGASSESQVDQPYNTKKRKRDANDITSGNGTRPDGLNETAKKTKKNGKTLLDSTSPKPENQTWAAHGENDGAMDSDFEFQIGDADIGVLEDFDGWGVSGAKFDTQRNRDKAGVDIDELIARRKGHKVGPSGAVQQGSGNTIAFEAHSPVEELSNSEVDGVEATDEEDETLAEDGFGMGTTESNEDDDGVEDGLEDHSSDSLSEDDTLAEPVPHPDDQDSNASSADEVDDPVENARREAFFAPEEKSDRSKVKSSSSASFQNMSLSRPILRGLAAVGFSEPTPIQSKTMPVALLGKDVVGGAVTGSGKTAAFIIPVLERLLYRPKKVPTSRVAILMPTRELAVQCFNVAKKLASFTDVTFCQLVGGFSLREQENVLRSRPDVIIATPGRFIDHMRNSASFTVDTLEILILDEADRMLEDGFAHELNEILTTIPKSRQTMLFSATMTDRVDKLIRVGLNRPVRLMVDARKQTVGTLVQEFVRLRPGREEKRLGYLMYLCQNVYTERVIIFFRQKREAHRVRVIFGLCGLKAAELHGSMSQEQVLHPLHSQSLAKKTNHLLSSAFPPSNPSAPPPSPSSSPPTSPPAASTSKTSPPSSTTKPPNPTKSTFTASAAPPALAAPAAPAPSPPNLTAKSSRPPSKPEKPKAPRSSPGSSTPPTRTPGRSASRI